MILVLGQQGLTVIDKLRGPLRGGLAYPSALMVVGVGGEGDAPELDLDQAVVGVPMVGAQAVGDQVAVGIILVITSAHGKVLVGACCFDNLCPWWSVEEMRLPSWSY